MMAIYNLIKYPILFFIIYFLLAPSSSPKGERRLRIKEALTRLSPLGELEGASI